ncbi:hypothetical protein DYU05_09465 [Mucilaginibacter terrenus]|uniref:Nucleotide-diphospho-sugar transferase domain-containing protein n=1 Tax=Mucilaginibacter terrenus TaxID=2482727 RepID=A0A3E2NXS7_9SPHI|nr:hypothetical protein [Mucilaginibacter terrenus]RFZ85803.1 hypothetical protein DYU05_09465 [Mucilaginibacter terrenus]
MGEPATVQQYPDLVNSPLPVFFLQLGSNTSLFFDKVIKQAALFNGKENVFVLTDTHLDQYKGYNCIDVTPYVTREREFDKVYRHHSTNPYFFEKTCFDRWFIINDLINDLGIDKFVYADCDVLILEDLKPVYDRFIKDKFDGSTMFFQRDKESVTSGHTSFWNSKLIADFCSFVVRKYTDEPAFNKLLEDTLSGKFLDNTNVSDMILLDVFRTETRPNVLNLLSLEDEGISIDFNINVAYNGWHNWYLCNKVTGIKKMFRKADGLYGQIAGEGTKRTFSKFYTLHFQGYITKPHIPLHVTAKSYNERVANRLSANSHYISRRLKLFKNKVRRSLLNR